MESQNTFYKPKDPKLKDLGKDFKFENLADAVTYLEKKYTVNYDIASKTLGQGDHHLYDFAHHPSLFGLIISIVAQLGGSTLGYDTSGVLKWVDCTESNAVVQGNNIFEKIETSENGFTKIEKKLAKYFKIILKIS